MSFISLLLYVIAIYMRPQEWVLAVYGWPLIYILTFTSAIFVFLESMGGRKVYLKEPPNMLMLGFFGCILMSHISHAYLQGSIDSIRFFAPNVIMFFLFVNILVTERKIKITIWLIIILTVILAVEGIQQHHSGLGWAGQMPIVDTESGETRIRWIGIFNDPNDLALIFVVSAGFLVSFIFGLNNLLVKILSCGMLFLIGQALFYTNSRGGFLAMAATITFFLLMKMKNKVFAIIVGVSIALSGILLGPSRMSQVSASEASAYGRIEAWYQGFQMLKSAPIFGVGEGMFTEHHFRAAHNSYISVAAELGMLGIFIWVSLIYSCFKGLVLVSRKSSKDKPYMLGLEAGLFGFLSASFFLSRSFIAVLYILLALSASFMYTILDKKEYEFTKKDVKISAILTIGILLLVWVSMRFCI
ncbi:MAG: O-antigen ligase family protein [Candidatus Omnitrophica bacterium]|nr:O-antigen ligase family protein [Candidatus Omnitrophota bacterium]